MAWQGCRDGASKETNTISSACMAPPPTKSQLSKGRHLGIGQGQAHALNTLMLQALQSQTRSTEWLVGETPLEGPGSATDTSTKGCNKKEKS
jgi:hypothetical protein